MGEIADSMIDGELCEQCGEYLGEAVGYPRLCVGCDVDMKTPVPQKNFVQCPKCNKRVKETGLHDHDRDKHGASNAKLRHSAP